MNVRRLDRTMGLGRQDEVGQRRGTQYTVPGRQLSKKWTAVLFVVADMPEVRRSDLAAFVTEPYLQFAFLFCSFLTDSCSIFACA